jgi:hypothetical protein
MATAAPPTKPLWGRTSIWGGDSNTRDLHSLTVSTIKPKNPISPSASSARWGVSRTCQWSTVGAATAGDARRTFEHRIVVHDNRHHADVWQIPASAANYVLLVQPLLPGVVQASVVHPEQRANHEPHTADSRSRSRKKQEARSNKHAVRSR